MKDRIVLVVTGLGAILSLVIVMMIMVVTGIFSILKLMFWTLPNEVWNGKEESPKEALAPKRWQSHDVVNMIEDSYLILVDGKEVTPLIGEDEAWLLFDEWCDTLADQVDLCRVLDTERLLPVKSFERGRGILIPELP